MNTDLIRRTSFLLMLFLFPVLLVNCGGGGGATPAPVSPPNSPTAQFLMDAAPGPVAGPPGLNNLLLQVAVIPENGFSGTVNVSITDIPAGVSIQPTTTFSLATDGTFVPFTNLTVNIGSSVAPGLYDMKVTGTSGSLQNVYKPQLQVFPLSAQLPDNRMNFIRTGATPFAAVFDPVHKNLFVSEPDLNRVDVISPSTQQIVASIPVPVPQGLDISLDNTRVFVGSNLEYISEIDTSTLQVVKRDSFAQLIPPNGNPGGQLEPRYPVVTANGKILVLYEHTSAPQGTLQWDPNTNSITFRQDGPDRFSGFTGGAFTFSKSVDGTKAIFWDQGNKLFIYNSATDTFSSSSTLWGPVTANPTGTEFVVKAPLGTFVIDPQFNTLATLPLPISVLGVFYSADGNTIYAVDQPANLPLITTINRSSLRVVGQAPAYSSVSNPYLPLATPLAMDDSGLIYAIADHGVAVEDATNFHTFAGTAASLTGSVEPDSGPLSGGIPINLGGTTFDSPANLWFGDTYGLLQYLDKSGFANVSSPPSSVAGPVNVKVIAKDGRSTIFPGAFTYEAQLLPLGWAAAGPEGGATIDIFGYGLLTPFGIPYTIARVGNTQAAVVSDEQYGQPGYPFPVYDLKVTVPAGISGPANISVSTPNGIANLPQAFHYLNSVRDYAINDVPQSLLYDRQRQRLYVSGFNRVDVFSVAGSTFLSPIFPPTLGGTRQLRGLALTPDGSKLLIANTTDHSIAIVDPDNPSNASAVAIPSGAPDDLGPFWVATTSTGKAFVSDSTNFGHNYLSELDLNTLSVTTRTENIGYMASSGDGSELLYFGCLWTSGTDQWTCRNVYQIAFSSAISYDGNVLAEGLTFSDSQMNAFGIGQQAEFYAGSNFTGEDLNDTGSLIYAASNNGVDVFDVQRGDQQERIFLKETLAFGPPRTIEHDSEGKHLFLLTNNGLTVVALDSEPLALGSVIPAQGPASGGTLVTIRGSGFTSGTTVSMGGAPASVTFADTQTLNIVTPVMTLGPQQIKFTNPDGTTYSVDDAFSAQ